MICISLSPPYATLIALNLKKIETRGWATSHRGQLGIHQTLAPGPRGTTEADLHAIVRNRPFCDVLFQPLGCTDSLQVCAVLPRGKIVAVVDLRGCIQVDSEQLVSYSIPGVDDWFFTDQERAFGDYSPGRWAWLLTNVRALPEPVSARGMPGLWRADAATTAAVEMQLGGTA